jgi:PAS domain S-box-containing protein
MESKEAKILVIDDYKGDLIFIKALISEAYPQAVVKTEESGQQGLKSARLMDPDIILLDIGMPGMDGYETCKSFKNDKQLSEIPVVFITSSYDDKEGRIKALEAGGDGFLAKPIDGSELTAQIRAMLKIREATRRKKDDRERLKELVAERTNELEANYALLQIAGQTAKFGGWSVDLKTNVVRWSDAVAEIHEMPHGYKPKVDEGISFYAPEWKEKITHVFNDCAQNGINYDEEMEIISANGKRKWVRTIGEAIRNENGEITIVHGSFQDISERKQSENALQKSNKKYEGLSTLMRLMADNMPDMLWAKNLNKEYIFANKAICDTLLGAADTDEPLGKTDMFFALRERAKHQGNPKWHTFGEVCRDSDAITLQEMKPMQFEEYGNIKGKFLILDVHKAPLFDDKNKLIGVVGSARDITEQKTHRKR